MTTTVTLDEDVERLLREAMHRSRRSFKETLNAAIRAGLSQNKKTAAAPPLMVKARPMGLQPGIDPAGFNKLADEVDTDAFLTRTRGARSK